MKRQAMGGISRMTVKAWVVACMLGWFAVSGSPLPCLADEQAAETGSDDGRARFELEEVVVTGTREEDSIREIPKNVTVITADDIAQAPSNNVVDLLAREANVGLRSFFGTDKQAGVDIRGMGDSFGSNVIVMVDGVRLNSPDLSGPALSSIPLDRIERIEIVRGAGSVLYGDGAVGGVINIITKKGDTEPEARILTSYGAYSTYDERASFGGRFGRVSLNANGDYYSTDGYRDNGYLRKKDAGVNAAWDLGERVTLSLAGSTHEDAYGLPGAVSKADANQTTCGCAPRAPRIGAAQVTTGTGPPWNWISWSGGP